MVEAMKQVFAILQEPASYTVDRNHAVYDKLGIDYCYIDNKSEAQSEENNIQGLSELNDKDLKDRLSDILFNYDIVIMNGYAGRVFRKLYRLNNKYHRIIGLDSDTQLRIPRNPIKRFVKWIYLNRIFKNKYYYGLAGGTGSHKELFRHYGMTDDRIFLMPMMVDNERFTYEDSKNGYRKFRFLYVGRIVEVKNISAMFEAFKKSFSDRVDVELQVVGKGDLLEQFKSEYGSVDNIHFAGVKYGNDLVDEYYHASALILPSSYEPWGLVVNEALAAGLPVIVSNQVGAAHDLVEGRDTGFVFPYHDTDKLAEQMKLLVEDTSLYRRYSQNAANLMKNYWNYDLYTECLNEFINKAAKAI